MLLVDTVDVVGGVGPDTGKLEVSSDLEFWDGGCGSGGCGGGGGGGACGA